MNKISSCVIISDYTSKGTFGHVVYLYIHRLTTKSPCCVCVLLAAWSIRTKGTKQRIYINQWQCSMWWQQKKQKISFAYDFGLDIPNTFIATHMQTAMCSRMCVCVCVSNNIAVSFRYIKYCINVLGYVDRVAILTY